LSIPELTRKPFDGASSVPESSVTRLISSWRKAIILYMRMPGQNVTGQQPRELMTLKRVDQNGMTFVEGPAHEPFLTAVQNIDRLIEACFTPRT
jgi:hypothetical protein